MVKITYYVFFGYLCITRQGSKKPDIGNPKITCITSTNYLLKLSNQIMLLRFSWPHLHFGP